MAWIAAAASLFLVIMLRRREDAGKELTALHIILFVFLSRGDISQYQEPSIQYGHQMYLTWITLPKSML